MGMKFTNPNTTGSGGSGTVTNVSSANADIGVSSGTTTPILTLNSGTGANQIVKRDGSGNLNATTVTTNANLTGDVTSVGNATTLTNAPVIAKVLTGYTSGAGVIAATDTILQAIQKLNGNDATNANLTGDVTSVGNATTLTNAPVIAKVLTGYVSGAGTVAATDSILQAVQKLNGNIATKAATQATTATWTTPTLLNSWINLGAPYYNAGFYKDDMAIVHFRGLIKSGTIAGGTALFVLPSGYRPLSTLAIPTLSNDGSVIVPILIEVAANGNVSIGGVPAGSSYLALDSISFRSEQ